MKIRKKMNISEKEANMRKFNHKMQTKAPVLILKCRL